MIESMAVIAGGVVLGIVALLFGLQIIAAAGRLLLLFIPAVAIVSLIVAFTASAAWQDFGLFVVAVVVTVTPVILIAKVRERTGSGIIKHVLQFFTPVGGPRDARHPDHLDWVNRRGKYAD